MSKILNVLLVFVVLTGCSRHKELKDMTFSGTLEMTEHVLGAKIPGRVTTLVVAEGDNVKVGQLLATLDRYEQAKKDYERTQALLSTGGTNAQAVEYAQLAMEDQEVISPVDGVVLIKTAELGETVSAGAGIVVIGDTKDQWVRIFVPEGIINNLKMNQEASIAFDGTSQSYQGHVSFIATKAEFSPRNLQTAEERVTQEFAIKVALNQPQTTIHAGVPADVRFNN